MNITSEGSLPIHGSDAHSLALTAKTLLEEPTWMPSAQALNSGIPDEINLTAETSYADHALPLIGIIDTGFDSSMMDIDPSQIMVGTDRTTDELSASHGSRIANTIYSVAEQSTLWISDSVGSGQWAQALTEFVDTAIATNSSHAIANLSFELTTDEGIPRTVLNQEEAQSLDYAQRNGIIVVAAAGNNGSSIGALGQASTIFDNIITVGSAENTERAAFSSYGAGLDILAFDSDQMMGTSSSAAAVSGGLAQIWQSNPSLSYQQLLDIAQASATDIYQPGPDLDSGAGIFDLEEAIALAQTTQGNKFTPQSSFDEGEWGAEVESGVEQPLALTLGKVTSGRIQAEDFHLDGYHEDQIGSIRSISVFQDKGRATAQFGGETGIYTLKVQYYDESDGQSSFELKVGTQSYKWTANGNYRDNYPTKNNAVIREFKNVVLTTGSRITLLGTKSRGERARIDHIDYQLTSGSSSSPSPSPSHSITPTPSPTRTPALTRRTLQAEAFTLNGFVVESDGDASAGQLIKTSSSGRATATFSGTTGQYDIKINYFDESDGRSLMGIQAGGERFAWSAHQNLSGYVATASNRTSRTFKGVNLQQGETITLWGQRQAEEYARIDSVEFIPTGSGQGPGGHAPSPSPRPVEPDIITPPQPRTIPGKGKANGEFQVKGEHIYDPSGREFIVKGVNKFTFDQGSSKTIDQIKNDWKFNTVRLNYFLEGESGQQLHSNIQAFSKQKVVTIVEIHDKTGKYWEVGELTQLKNWFRDLAKRYKDNPYVWFNIANEPGGSKSAQQADKWIKQHQEVIKVIRNEVGASNPIVVDAHFWGQDVGEWNGANVREDKSSILHHGDKLKSFGGKSYDNIIFSVHMYDQWNFGEAKMANYLDRIEDKDHAVIVGEYGQINTSYSTKKATEAMFKTTAPREIGRIAWVWSAKDSNDLTTTKNGGGEHINNSSNPSNLSWLGQKVWADNRRRENLHQL